MARKIYWNICKLFLLWSVSTSYAQNDTDIIRYSSDQIDGGEISLYPVVLTNVSKCDLQPVDPEFSTTVQQLIKSGVKLIQFDMSVANRSENPLTKDSKYVFKPNQWSRASTKHGQALLALSYNFGVLSLTTLTFGIKQLSVNLQENPEGCLNGLDEKGRMKVVEKLLIRDFKDAEYTTTLKTNEFICYQVITHSEGSREAKFVERCCHKTETDVHCEEDLHNIWIHVINVMMLIMKIGVFLFGPLLIPARIYSDEFDTHPYVVKFKDVLRKSIRITYSTAVKGFTPRFIMDLRERPGFVKFRQMARNLPKDETIPVKFNEFHITVPYRKLQKENKVRVGLINSLMRAICMCKIRDVDPCKVCCFANMFSCCKVCQPYPWVRFFRILGRILLVLCIPIPYYIRILFYYLWEVKERQAREAAAHKLGLTMPFDVKLLTYLTPIHPVSIVIYIIYLVTAFLLCTPPEASLWSRRFRRIVIGAFRDLHALSWLDAVAMITSIFLWPLRKFGLVGCLIGIVYWPIVLPLGAILCLIYCLPLVYLTFRMLISSRSMIMGRNKDKVLSRSKQAQKRGNILENSYLSKISPRLDEDQSDEEEEDMNCKQIAIQLLVGFMCVISLLAIMFMFTECVCFLIEVAVFTMMGIIANASTTLRYVTLTLLIMLYSYDIFNNVNKQYQKLNSALFSDIKGRIKGLQDITMLPSSLQINQAFKAVELSQQAGHEFPDELWRKEDRIHDSSPLCWHINDLLLFVDSEDLPRIPTRLFDEVCRIRVAGAPGPVYRALLKATGQFLAIIFFLIFVFLVVMSFGDVYGVSTTNQTLATVAGGFLPYILRTFFSPKARPITLSSLTFKCKMDEVIKGFRQAWSIGDLQFTVDDGKPEEGEEETEADKKPAPNNHLFVPVDRRRSATPVPSEDESSVGDAPDGGQLMYMHDGDVEAMADTAGMAVLIQETAEREHARDRDDKKKRDSNQKGEEEKYRLPEDAQAIEIDPTKVDLLVILTKPKKKTGTDEEKIALKNVTVGIDDKVALHV